MIHIGDLALPYPYPPGKWVKVRAALNASDNSPHVCPVPAFGGLAEAEAWDKLSLSIQLNVHGTLLLARRKALEIANVPEKPRKSLLENFAE